MEFFTQIKTTINKNQRLPMLISLVCLALLILILAQMIRGLFSTHIKTTHPVTINLPHHVVRLADWHLFGMYDAHASLLPETRLPLILKGTMLAIDDTQISRALISTAGHTKIYSVGQTVPGGATIKKIEHNHIVLNVHGQLERLRIPVPKLTSNKIY